MTLPLNTHTSDPYKAQPAAGGTNPQAADKEVVTSPHGQCSIIPGVFKGYMEEKAAKMLAEGKLTQIEYDKTLLWSGNPHLKPEEQPAHHQYEQLVRDNRLQRSLEEQKAQEGTSDPLQCQAARVNQTAHKITFE